MREERETAWLRLQLTPGLGRVGMLRLLRSFGSPEEALAVSPGERAHRARLRPEVAAAIPRAEDSRVATARTELEKAAARIIPFDHQDYPEPLRRIYDPPALLYLRGKLPGPEALAVVGARRASRTGLIFTEELCAELASLGIAVVSGLARGVDAAAHQGSLAAGGTTTAVLGCGIDRIYPPENARLFHRIAEEGGVVTEYPPGTLPLAGHFPGRNRIISGLCRGVLVVEAAAGSGSLITAEFALEQGREVFAVPGPVRSPTSEGVHALLREGAHLATSARDVLEVLWPDLATPGSGPAAAEEVPQGLEGKALEVYRLLTEQPLSMEDLLGKSGLTPPTLSDILLHLELQGSAEQLPGMRFVRANRARRGQTRGR